MKKRYPIPPIALLAFADGFVGFIGGGENERGRFPENLSELNDDLREFVASRYRKEGTRASARSLRSPSTETPDKR